MKLRFTLHNVGLAALVCLAALAIAQPVWAGEDNSPPPEVLEATRSYNPAPEEATGTAAKSAAFKKVEEAPKIGTVDSERVTVDMRTIKTSENPPELIDFTRTHIQGQLDFDTSGRSANSDVLSPERATPAAPMISQSDTREPDVQNGTAGTQVTSWDAGAASGWIPPDTQLAVGPEYIVEAVNSGFRVYTKRGTQTRAYTSFSSFVNLPSPWSGFCYDPRVVFDYVSDKFLMMIMGKDSTNLKSYYWLMVSVTDDPNGSWWVWRVNASAGAAGSEEWLDYAAIAVDNWGIYVTGNYFLFGGGYQRTQLWSWGNDFMTGSSTSHYYWADLNWPAGANAFTTMPAMPVSTNSADHTFYLTSYWSSGNEVCLWTQNGKRHPASTDPDGASISRVAIPSKTYYAMGNNVDQPGSSWDIDGGNTTVQDAVYGNGRITGTFALNWDNNKVYSEVYFFDVTEAGAMNYDYAHWNPNYSMNYPALTRQPGTSAADIALTFSMTEPGSSTGWIGAASFGWDPTGAASTHWAWQRGGLGTYSRWDGAFEGDGRNRWGDYSGAGWDWSCQNAWFNAEYATASNSWATRIFARTLGTYDPCVYFHVSSPNGGQTYTAGTTQTITWERMWVPAADEVHISVWNGSSWVAQAGPLATTASSYSWKVPNLSTSVAKIRVGNQPAGGGTFKDWDTTDGTFTIVAIPDLTHSLLSAATSYTAGTTYSVYNSVRNIGPATAGGFNAELRLSVNTTCSTFDTLVGTRRISSLVGNGTLNTVSTSMTIPAGTAGGAYYLCQLIDIPLDEVDEFDETNNTTYEPITVIDPTFFSDGFESGNMTAWSNAVP